MRKNVVSDVVKTNRQSWLLFVVMILIVCATASTNVHAVALGVNKAALNFNDVLRGGYAEDVITVTTDSIDEIQAEVRIEGEAGGWLRFSNETFYFSRDNPYQLHVIMEPPLDTQVQDYAVNLTIITGGLTRSDGKMGTSIRASFRIPIVLHMTGTERISCVGGGVQVFDTEQGRPLDVKVSLINQGNVRINPNISIEIWDKSKNTLLTTSTVEFGSRILPTKTDSATRTFSFNLDPSQYWAKVSVPLCEYDDMQSFDVLEPGGIKDDGELIRIEAQSWAVTGDIIPIKAYFRNKGVRGVRAVLKGTIERADNHQVVKIINTDEYIVGPDATAEIDTFFNPTVGGQYIVTGKVFYNNKLTTERSTLINVNGSPVNSSGTLKFVILIIIIIIILLLLIIIKRRKKQATHPSYQNPSNGQHK